MRTLAILMVFALGLIALLLFAGVITWEERTYATPAAAAVAGPFNMAPESGVTVVATTEVSVGQWVLAREAPTSGRGHCLSATYVMRRRAGLRYGLRRGWQAQGQTGDCPGELGTSTYAASATGIDGTDEKIAVVFGDGAPSESVIAAVTWEDDAQNEVPIHDGAFIVSRLGHIGLRTLDLVSAEGEVLRVCRPAGAPGVIRCHS